MKYQSFEIVNNGVMSLQGKIQNYNEGRPESLKTFLNKCEYLVQEVPDRYPAKVIYYTIRYRIENNLKLRVSERQVRSLVLSLYSTSSLNN